MSMAVRVKSGNWADIRYRVIQALDQRNLPVEAMGVKALPSAERAIKAWFAPNDWEQAFALVEAFVGELMENRILPCSLVELGVPLAAKRARGSLNEFANGLEDLIVRANDIRARHSVGSQHTATIMMLDKLSADLQNGGDPVSPTQGTAAIAPTPVLTPRKTTYHEENINKPGAIWGRRDGNLVMWFQEDIFCTRDFLHDREREYIDDPADYDRHGAEKDYQRLKDEFSEYADSARQLYTSKIIKY